MKYGKVLAGVASFSRIKSISKEAQIRLYWLDWYKEHGGNAELTCRHFGISKSVFYRWKNRFSSSKKDLTSLESVTSKPHTVRSETIDYEIVSRILKLKDKYKRWGKHKILVLLLVETPGIKISESSVGRVLKRRGLVNMYGAGAKGRKKSNIYIQKLRASREDRDLSPGHEVQVDVKYYRVETYWYYRFVAIDTKTRIKFQVVYGSKTASIGETFLKELERLFPFPIEGYQTDNGSEFLREFHAWIEDNHRNHYFSYAYTPQMNGRVERVIKTDSEEFWDFEDPDANLEELNRLAREWDYVYNYIRPHQALGDKTPMQYYASIKSLEETVLKVLN